MVSPDLCTPEKVAPRATRENLRLPFWRVNQIIVPRMGVAGGPHPSTARDFAITRCFPSMRAPGGRVVRSVQL